MDNHQLVAYPNTDNGKDSRMVRCISPLELLLPDGIAKLPVVLGSNLPIHLLPEVYSTDSNQTDFAILAPTAAQCRTNGWLEEAVRSLAQALAPDGLLYAFVPRRFRLPITSLMRDYNLSVGPFLAHLPNPASNRYLVPLNPITIRYTLANILSASPQKQRLATLAFSLFKSQELIFSMLPFVGIVARRADARPLFDWLFKLGNDSNSIGNAVIRTRWRANKGTAVLFRFPDGNALPDAAAKVSLVAPLSTKTPREAEIITRTGSSAHSAGARVPKALAEHQIEGHTVVLQTLLNGQSAAALLFSQPKRLPLFMGHVTQWLDHWNRATAILKPLDGERLDQELIAPAKLLEPYIEEGREYRDWLTARCNAAIGTTIPFVTAHGDLTMSNLLFDEHEQIGIIDWEASVSEALPLTDFFYAAADAAAATRGYVDRVKAFQSCFMPGGSYVEAIKHFQTNLRRSLKIPPDVADLCFHACWLRHAANEYRSDPPNRRRFINVVRFLAAHRSDTISWMQT